MQCIFFESTGNRDVEIPKELFSDIQNIADMYRRDGGFTDYEFGDSGYRKIFPLSVYNGQYHYPYFSENNKKELIQLEENIELDGATKYRLVYEHGFPESWQKIFGIAEFNYHIRHTKTFLLKRSHLLLQVARSFADGDLIQKQFWRLIGIDYPLMRAIRGQS